MDPFRLPHSLKIPPNGICNALVAGGGSLVAGAARAGRTALALVAALAGAFADRAVRHCYKKCIKDVRVAVDKPGLLSRSSPLRRA